MHVFSITGALSVALSIIILACSVWLLRRSVKADKRSKKLLQACLMEMDMVGDFVKSAKALTQVIEGESIDVCQNVVINNELNVGRFGLPYVVLRCGMIIKIESVVSLPGIANAYKCFCEVPAVIKEDNLSAGLLPTLEVSQEIVLSAVDICIIKVGEFISKDIARDQIKQIEEMMNL